MSRPDPDPHDPGTIAFPAWAPAAIAVAMMVTIGGLTTWLVLTFDAARPKVGDIVEFVRRPPDAESWRLLVAASAIAGRDPAAGPCLFDPNEMSAAGGSLLIEAREATSPPKFHLHWAGGRTAKGAGDCGASADLILDRADLQRLANAAGGFGIRPKAN